MPSFNLRHWIKDSFSAGILIASIGFAQIPFAFAQTRLVSGQTSETKEAKHKELNKILNVLKQIASRNHKSIDSKSSYPNDSFVNSLSKEDIKILDHFGANVASHLFEYCVVANRALNALAGDGMGQCTELLNKGFTEKEWRALNERSVFIQNLDSRSRKIIQLGGVNILSRLHNLVLAMEDKLVPLLDGINSEATLNSIASNGDPNARTKVNQFQKKEIEGNYSEALQLAERTTELALKKYGENSYEYIDALSQYSKLQIFYGSIQNAQSNGRVALELSIKMFGERHHLTSVAASNLAMAYSRLSKFKEAEVLYALALTGLISEYGENSPVISTTKMNIGMLYNRQGLTDRANAILLDTAKGLEDYLNKNQSEDNKPFETILGVLYSNLSDIKRQLKEYEASDQYALKGIEILKRIHGSNHLYLLTARNNLAGAYMAQEKWSQAGQLLHELIAYLPKIGIEASLAKQNLAIYYTKHKTDFSKARTLLAEAYEGLDSVNPGTDTNKIRILQNLVYLSVAQKAHKEAEVYSGEYVQELNELIYAIAPYLARDARNSFLRSINQGTFNLLIDRSSLSKNSALQALKARLNRQGLLEEIEKRQAQLSTLPGKQQKVVEELKALTHQLSSLTLKPEQRQSLRVRKEKLEKQLYRLLPQLKPRVVEVQQVANALPADSVLIEFQKFWPFTGVSNSFKEWGQARYLAMVLKPDASITVVDLGEASGIDQAITTAVSATRRGLGDTQKHLAKVTQLLIEPLNSATAGSKTWFVSPDGELNRLPFAALPSANGDGYLTEAVDLRLLTTGRELLDLQQPNPKAQSAALVVADPAYGKVNRPAVSLTPSTQQERASGDGQTRSADLSDQLIWAPLPATAQEGETVKAITGGSLLVQGKATADAVKQTPSPKLLHLATHAFYLPNQAKQQPEPVDGLLGPTSSSGVVRRTNLQGESPLLRSGIALAGANQPGANPNDDGYLTALEVAQLAWEGTDLVVISACESGLGDLQVGEGVYGLKRAIAVAGARSSLLSLWKVDDEATKVFMEGFYARLKQGQGKADALANTQKEFRESPERSAYRRPYYWAAFQLSGDWKPVRW